MIPGKNVTVLATLVACISYMPLESEIFHLISYHPNRRRYRRLRAYPERVYRLIRRHCRKLQVYLLC